MADDASGDGSDENEGRQEPSATEPDRDEHGWNAADESTTPDDGFTVGFEDASSTDSGVGADERNTGVTDDHGSGRDRIPLDLSSDADETATSAEEEPDPYAPEPSSAPVEAGNPDLENAMFVVLGAAAMILVVLRVVSIPM